MFLRWMKISYNWELKHWFGFGRTCAIVDNNKNWKAWNRDKLQTTNGKCDYTYQSLKEAMLNIKSFDRA